MGLPQAVEVDGSSFFIKTDFRVWLKFDEVIQKKGCTVGKLAFVLEEPSEMRPELVKPLVDFYLNENSTPKGTGSSSGRPVISYKEDGEFIYSAFRKYYNINLLTDKLHWHEFLGLLRGIFNDYKDIVSYRSYEGDDKEQIKLKNSWALEIIDNTTEEQREVISILKGDGDLTKL